jgi:sugar lactone lactonase YvrE
MLFSATRIIVCLFLATVVSGASITGSVCGAAELQYPVSIAVAKSGDQYLADRNLPGIWKISGGKLSLYFQGSKKFRTPLNAVRCVRLDHEGKLLAGDSATRNIYRFDDNGQPQPITKTANGMGLIGIPMDIAVNSKGDIYVSDLEIQRVVKIPAGSDQPEEVAKISGCRGLFIDKDDNLWVVSTTNDQLHRITPKGEQTIVVKGHPFEFPHTVVVSSDGTAFVCDGYAKTIWKIAADGKPVALVAGEPLVNPVGMAIKDDILYVVDPRAKSVFTINATGKITKVDLQTDE